MPVEATGGVAWSRSWPIGPVGVGDPVEHGLLVDAVAEVPALALTVPGRPHPVTIIRCVSGFGVPDGVAHRRSSGRPVPLRPSVGGTGIGPLRVTASAACQPRTGVLA